MTDRDTDLNAKIAAAEPLTSTVMMADWNDEKQTSGTSKIAPLLKGDADCVTREAHTDYEHRA